jgi:hypothetical protein
MTHLDWYLDPESAGYVVTAIDTLVGHDLRTVRFHPTQPGGGAGSESGSDADAEGDDLPESRTLGQLRSDAATDVFRHLAACTPPTGTTPAGTMSASVGRPPVTMIVRIGLDALHTGTGSAEIDGIAAPISARTARRLAADAHLIPAVLGSNSEVLDLGRSRRLFSRAQRLALAERDDGCAWPGCPHPPSYTEAHHIRWWDAHTGPTDLNNGILLCTTHHHRIHADNWDIPIHNNTPHFNPPSHIDPHRKPRPGGRIRHPTNPPTPISWAS